MTFVPACVNDPGSRVVADLINPEFFVLTQQSPASLQFMAVDGTAFQETFEILAFFPKLVSHFLVVFG